MDGHDGAAAEQRLPALVGGGVPVAFVLHLSLRTLARRARKRHALARGKRVAAAVSKGELRRG